VECVFHDEFPSEGDKRESTVFERQLELDDPRSVGPGVSPFQCCVFVYSVVLAGITAGGG
jgi:hypothetical protein